MVPTQVDLELVLSLSFLNAGVTSGCRLIHLSSLPSPFLTIAMHLPHLPDLHPFTLPCVHPCSHSDSAGCSSLLPSVASAHSTDGSLPLQPWALCRQHTTLDQACPILCPGCCVNCQWDPPTTLSPTPLLCPLQRPRELRIDPRA